MCHKWHLTLLTYEIYAIYIKITIKKSKRAIHNPSLYSIISISYLIWRGPCLHLIQSETIHNNFLHIPHQQKYYSDLT